MSKINHFFVLICRKRLTILFLILVLILITLLLWGYIELNTLYALLGALITAYFGILRQNIDDDKVFRELFIAFNSRYSNKTNDLLNTLRIGNINEINESEKLLIIDYFNLCSEEYLWYKKGRIPSIVWKAWESGILVNLSIPIVKDLFLVETKEEKQKMSYYGFTEHIFSKMNI